MKIPLPQLVLCEIDVDVVSHTLPALEAAEGRHHQDIGALQPDLRGQRDIRCVYRFQVCVEDLLDIGSVLVRASRHAGLRTGCRRTSSSVDSSKPAICRQDKTGNFRRLTEVSSTSWPPPCASPLWIFVRQLHIGGEHNEFLVILCFVFSCFRGYPWFFGARRL
jgi:hypothetical protein